MIVATRILKVIGPTEPKEVPIHLFAPEEQGGVWSCRYEIGWPGSNRASAAYGSDAIQALHLALQKIGIELYTSAYHKNNQLAWDEQGEGYGFPVSKNVRDILIGEDLDL